MSLPAPDILGLPAQFTSWRQGQTDAVLYAIDRAERQIGLVLPTGFGKSLVYMAIAHLTGRKTVILTSTKALQAQLARDFQTLHPTVVQGMRAYLCKALEPGGELRTTFAAPARDVTYVDHGPCHLGVDCSLKLGGCDYFDAIRAAGPADITITNYAWWLSLYRNPIIRLRPELLVLDEAHAAPDALASAIGATLTHEVVQRILGEKLGTANGRSAEQWVEWARHRAGRLARLLEGTHPATREAVGRIRLVKNLHYAVDRIAAIHPSLLLASDDLDGVKFDVIWAAAYGEDWLFRRVPKVILTSATMTRHTADLVGVLEKEFTLYEAGAGFPVARRPVYLCAARRPPFGQALQVDHRMSSLDEEAWIEHVDRILASRADRKGIIHSISYKRRDLILARSRFADRLLTHGRHDTAQRIADFKGRSASSGAVFVSPAVTTGYDFPYDECEYQIVCKIPFPDRRDPVTKARELVDPRYPAHVAMQELVQAVGRGMRSADDQCETFIVDAHAFWFLSKHADLAPRWFRKALARLEAGTIPSPPRPLGSCHVGAQPHAGEGETV